MYNEIKNHCVQCQPKSYFFLGLYETYIYSTLGEHPLKKDNGNKANVGIYKYGKNANRNQDEEVKLPAS